MSSTPSPSKERFLDHPVHATLAQWLEKLPTEKPSPFRTLDAQARDPYVRLRWILRDLHNRLAQADHLLLAPAVLDAANKHLNQLQSHWDQYRASPTDHWQPLRDATDALANSLRGLPSGSGAATWTENLEELRDDMTGTIADAQAAIADLRRDAATTSSKYEAVAKQLKDLEAEIQSQKTRLDQMLTQHSEAFTKAEQDRVTQFTKAEQDRAAKFTEGQDQKKSQFDAMTAELEQAKNDFASQHQEAMTQRADAFAAAQGEQKSACDTLVATSKKAATDLHTDQKTEFDELVADATSKQEALLSQLSEQLDKAVEIVGTIVKTTMSGNYQIIAHREYRNAWIMRAVAIASFLLMGAMVIWAVWSMNFSDNGIEWGTFAFRLSLGVAFLIPGIYCAKEAGRHWNAEKHNRRIALELAALDPFLVKLDEAKRKEIIERKADEYFGHGSADPGTDGFAGLKDTYLRGDQLFKLAQQIAKIVRG